MQPTQFSYPEFVPDQVLTSSNLNDLFSYLDEQERLTRTNLIGVGIVCGLDVTTNAAGTQLTISAGCGVTTGGYLITFPKTTFSQYKDYNALKPLYYEKFVNGTTKTQYYKLAGLFESAVVQDGISLTQSYLQDKVVMLYVEMLEDNAKNCDPGSCDDKGKNIDITFRPLLISIDDAAKLKTTGLDYGNTDSYKKLPVLKMPRFNVPATLLQSSTQVFESYRKILTNAFIEKVQKVLTKTYEILLPVVKDIYPDNPFAQLSASLAFLNNNNITATEAINFQYYYDLFSDIEIAYDELRETGMEALSMCCPDVNLFRLHLLLGNAIAGKTATPVSNRQYFIPSPVMECQCKQTLKLRWLFQRIQLMLQNFYVDFGAGGNFGKLLEFEQFRRKLQDTTIRITPSTLGNVPLAKKAIPFYYTPIDGDETLLDNWDIEKTANGEADQNLSYNANQYATDDFVLNPLNYDLEPYNFLRIEGHIGMSYTTALKQIVSLRDKNRLPFEVVVLSSDLESLKTALANLGKTNTVAALIQKYASQIKSSCHFQDLDAIYDTLIAELTCGLCKTMLYFYGLSEPAPQGNPNPVLSVVPLVLKCNPSYHVQPATFGYLFEQFYTEYNNGDGVGYLYGSFFPSEKRIGFDTNINVYYLLLLSIEHFYETFASSLGAFDYNAFSLAYKRLIRTATDIQTNLEAQTEADAQSRETLDQLKKLIAICVQKPMETLYRDYLLRWVYVMMLQKFGYYARKHPGIQHKAGVTMGGTFIMVYHEANAISTTPAAVAPSATEKAGTKKAGAASGLSFAEKAAQTRMSIENSKQKISGRTINPNDYQYASPAYNSGVITDVNDASIFKTENQKEFDDLALLMQDIKDTQSSLTDVVSGIANGTVIADFYLPYLCCSDCPPIQYTVNEIVENITISVMPSVFCSADTQPYDITVTPDGGEVTGDGSSKNAAGKFIFTPSAVTFAATDKQKDITLTYAAFGQSVSAKVTVYQKPVADFDAVAIDGGNVVTITNKSSAFADKYSWDFGDGQTTADRDPSPHTYNTDNTYTITLIVLNNVCSDKLTKTVTVTTPDVSIAISKTEFCSNDSSTYQITTSPAGVIVTGEGIAAVSGGGFQFTPNLVQLSGSVSKKITLTAQKGAKSKSQDLTVYQQPTANFTVTPVTAPGAVAFTNNSSAFATKYQWDFGDGNTSDQQSPGIHTYAAGGTYQVSLTVFNNNCSDVKVIPVSIALPQPTIDIVPKAFCINDTTPHNILLGTNGGVVTGEGVTQTAAGGYVFTPSGIIFPPGTPSLPVVLTNKLGTQPATVQVTVYQMPTGDFVPQPGTAPLNIQFINQTINADKFNWSFDTQGTSTQRDPNFKFSIAGTFNVTLKATNGDVCTLVLTKPVTVGQPAEAKKTCLPVANITLDKLDALMKDPKNKEIAATFLKAFPAYNSEVTAFFKEINNLGTLSVTAQTAKFVQLNAVALLTKWINQLTALLKQPALATIITALILVLAELIEYISCFQQEDIDKANISMAGPLDALGAFIKAFLDIFNKATAAQKQALATAMAQMQQLDADLQAEIARVNSNNEAIPKAKYLAILKKLIQLFG